MSNEPEGGTPPLSMTLETTIKPIWASKTVITNLVTALWPILCLAGVDLGLGTMESVIVILVNLSNIVLRAVTTEPITIPGVSSDAE